MNNLLQLNNDLMGAPSGVLIMLFAVAIGYLLKSMSFFENKYIPGVVVLFSIVGFLMIAPARTPDVAARIWWGKNIIFGVVFGCLAWLLHARLLKRFIDVKLWPDDAGTPPPK